ncbi:glutamate receptor-like [Penaeus vannamei]|uniref:glutamate receptor-like n=1 Tax=Penaeus vannamei TaxID=6689 RepID=UPI00387FA134
MGGLRIVGGPEMIPDRPHPLWAATAGVLASLPENVRLTSKAVNVCCAGNVDSSFLLRMWTSEAVPLSVWSEGEWRSFLARSTYQDGATHVIVGTRAWILDVLLLIGESIRNKSINIQKTQWVAVSTEQADGAFRRALENNLPEMTRFLLLQENRPKTKRNPGKSTNSSVLSKANEPSSFSSISQMSSNSSKPNEPSSVSSMSSNPSKPNEPSSFSPISPISSKTSKPSSTTSIPTKESPKTPTMSQVVIHLAEYPGDGGPAILRWAGSWDDGRGVRLQDPPLQFKPPEHFHGRNMTLTTVHKPRVFEVEAPDGALRTTLQEVDGYVAEVVRILQKRLNFSAVLTTTNTFGSLQENGSWNGMMSYLWEAEADLSPLDFSPSWDRAQAVDFSEWFSTDDVIVISKAPQPLVKPFLVFEVFTAWVWFAVVASAVTSGLLLWGVDCLVKRAVAPKMIAKETASVSVGEMVASALKLFVLQGNQKWGSTLPGRALASCLFLVAISVVALYQGYIIAFLAVPRKAAPINSAFDLMARLPQVKPVVRKNTVYYHFVVNFETFSPIAANLEFHQDTFLNTWDFFQLIHKGKYALIDTYSSGVGRAASFETQGKECRFYVSKNVLKGDLDLMAHRQNSIFRERVDRALTQLRSFGIIEKVKNAFYSTSCERETGKRDPMALGLTQVQGAFYLLLAGIGISICGILTEFVVAFGNRGWNASKK